MNENTDVEILPPEALEPEIEFLEATPRKRFGLAGILATAFLASALGAGAMYLVAEFLKTPAPTVNLVPLTERVDALNTENKTLKAQLTRLQRDMKASPKPLAVDLSGIETRLERLEAAKPQALDPDLIARLEALRVELARMVHECSGGTVGECRVLGVLRDHDECLTQHNEIGA